MRTDDVTYDPLTKMLHWIMALLILALLALGLYVQQLPFSPQKLKLLSWHKWAGICALFLIIIRLSWRATRTALPTPPGTPKWQRLSASFTHVILYLLMFAVPLSGWLMSSAKGVPTVLFSIWPLPDLVARNNALADILGPTHWYLNVLLMISITLHVGAALKHRFIDKDKIMARMLLSKPSGIRTK